MSVATTPSARQPGNLYHPNGRPHTLHPQERPCTLLPTPSPMNGTNDYFSNEDQVQRLSDIYKQRNIKIGVLYPTGGHRVKADAIVGHLNHLLSGGSSMVKVYEMRKDGQFWLSIAANEGVSKYVFVGVPPGRARGPLFSRQSSSVQEDDFFDPHTHEARARRITEVVFIDTPLPTPQTPSQGRRASLAKNYEGFLHLNCDLDAALLAEIVLGHFAAMQPVPFDIDNAYWSEVPKLIAVTKDRPSLGITLVTREMSPESCFPRIALIKSLGDDCVPELRNRVGRYTHVQSINGNFLDGLNIKEISEIFQTETRRDQIQLMVRFIHLKRRTSAPPPPPKPAPPLDPSREDLPTPVFILADNHTTARQLFTSITSELGPRGSLPSLLTPTHPRGNQGSAVSQGTGVSDKSLQGGSDVSAPDEYTEGLPSLGATIQKAPNKANKIRFPVDSDPCVIRKDISPNFYNGHPVDYSPISTPGSRPGYKRTTSLMKQDIAAKRYIMQMFSKDFDRRFAHIFFRTSGLFLVTAWLGELADDPLIQHENLSVWLRLIQSRTGCAEEKRVIIVGMFDGREQDELPRIQNYVSHLNNALHESELNKQLFDHNRNRRLPGMGGKQQYVFMFDVSRSDSCYELIGRMEECMDLFMEKALHFDKPLFDSIFSAFDGLNVALREVSVITGIVGQSENLRTICNQKPKYALDTLAAYSTAFVDSKKEDILLKPHFLLEFLTKLGTMTTSGDRSLYEVFTITARHLKNLPVVSSPWSLNVAETIAHDYTDFPLTNKSKEAILDWAERLGLMLKIGQGQKKEIYYFVPSLATVLMGVAAKYHWSEEEEAFYKSSKATVLYAYLHFPANHLFFNRVLSELLKDGSSGMELYINLDCKEAILPLALVDSKGVLSVMIVYHQLQNVIEFRYRRRSQRDPVELSFLKAVEHKLYCAYSNSSFVQFRNFDNAVTFHIPSSDYDDKLKESALWKLWELELRQRQEDDESDGEEESELLLKTRELTKELQGDWAASHPEMKNIPSELFMRWARKLSSSHDYWSMVGAKLKLLSTDDIQVFRTTPHKGGNGEEVMRRWSESALSYKELVVVLQSPEVRLDALAKEIEEYFSGSDV